MNNIIISHSKIVQICTTSYYYNLNEYHQLPEEDYNFV